MVRESRDRPAIEVEYKTERRRYYLEEILAILLLHMKQLADNYLGHTFADVVLTTPAYYCYQQRASLKLAAELAGLSVLRIISAPVCAAIEYGIQSRKDSIPNVVLEKTPNC